MCFCKLPLSLNPLPQISHIYTGDKSYICDICGKGFIENGSLQRHIRTHTGDTPYKCDFCGKLFSDHIYKVYHQYVFYCVSASYHSH
jgi:uncharacterized Zn-finger protein